MKGKKSKFSEIVLVGVTRLIPNFLKVQNLGQWDHLSRTDGLSEVSVEVERDSVSVYKRQ